MKRHNLAVERLSETREEYSQERQQRLDYLKKTISQQKHAEQTFGDLGVAMQEYHKVTGQQLSPLRDPPKLADFYNPSRQRKDAELAVVFGGVSILGLIGRTNFCKLVKKKLTKWSCVFMLFTTHDTRFGFDNSLVSIIL